MVGHVKGHCLIISLAGLLVILPLTAFKNSSEVACVFLYSKATQVSPKCTIYSALRLLATQLALDSILFFVFSPKVRCLSCTFYFADDIIQVPWTVYVCIDDRLDTNWLKWLRKVKKRSIIICLHVALALILSYRCHSDSKYDFKCPDTFSEPLSVINWLFFVSGLRC